ncbi:MAG: hypothetical protein OEL76_04195 [Siculibacillus sp.]|nr:hypothetical protein [Siculibacillus sp.]
MAGTSRGRVIAAVVAVGATAIVFARAFPDRESAGSSPAGVTRSVRTDLAVDLPLDPGRADAPAPKAPVAPVRIAVKNATVAAATPPQARVAPIELVAADALSDLQWDAGSGDLRERDEVVARRIGPGDLPAAADRVALLRRVRDFVQSGGQAIRLSPDGRSFRLGADIDLTLPKSAGRAIVVASVAGDGKVSLLYPLRGDRPVAEGDVQIQLTASEPEGVEQIVALATDRELTALVTSLRRLDGRRAAGELLGLVDSIDRSGLVVGLQSILIQR